MHSLLLLLDEVVFDDLIQASAVRLDEAFHLCVVQSSDLVIVKLFIKLKRQAFFKCATHGLMTATFVQRETPAGGRDGAPFKHFIMVLSLFTFSNRSSSRVSCSFLLITDDVSEYSVNRLLVSSSVNRNSRPCPSSSVSSWLNGPPSESNSSSSSASSHSSSSSSSPLSQVTNCYTSYPQIETLKWGFGVLR